MTFNQLLIEIIGWIGMVLILFAYVQLSRGRMTGRSPAYQWLNVVGAACFVVNSGYKHAWPSAVLNVIWAGIGVYTLWVVGRRAAANRGE
jgi:hypothetical protein